MADVTVIIPSYRSRSTIFECIASLKRQKVGNVTYDIIVVDSSPDDTARIITERYPDVRVIASARRLLPGAARNAGIRSSTSQFVAFIDSDCVAEETWLDSLLLAIRGLGCDIAGGPIRTLTRYHIFGATAYLSEFSEFLSGRKTGPAGFLPTANMIARRDIFTKSGLFPEYRLGSEDRLFAETVIRNGGTIYFAAGAVVWHNDRKVFSKLARHQFDLAYESAQARKTVQLDGYFIVSFPLLTPLIPVLRYTKLLYRLCRCHEYSYFFFAVANLPTFLVTYLVWTAGFVTGILRADDRRIEPRCATGA